MERIDFICDVVKERQDIVREYLIEKQLNPNRYIEVPTYEIPVIGNDIERDEYDERTQ